MVTHAFLDVLHAYFAIRLDPKRHVLSIGIFTKGPRQIAVEIIVEVAEERPHAGIAIATATEVRSSIGPLPREIGISTLIPSHQASIANDILRVVEVGLLVLGVGINALRIDFLTREETTDTALVSMSTDGIVGNALSHPHHAIELLLGHESLVATRAHHLEDPSLVGVADGEGLTFRVIAVELNERGHHGNGFTS